MAYEIRKDTGSLHANTRRREGKDDPNAQGQLKLSAELIETLYNKGGDQIVWVSAWTKAPREEGKRAWQSLSVREPRSAFEGATEAPAAPRAQPQQAQGAGNGPWDDDIPFAPCEHRSIA